VLAYLGKAEGLLRRLQGLSEGLKVKSYSHGAVAALLDVAGKLEIPSLINEYVKSPRPYVAEKPIRNHLTVGITLLLGAIGRVCMPTSKRGWWNWAKGSSCEYLLRCSLSKIDSQHFWDLMDALPIEAIEKIELRLLERVQDIYDLTTDTLLFDTTNFYTFIATTNERCTIAQRGRNKQKRHDLRQVGMALIVTQKDFIPLFHISYEGNLNDTVIFRRVIAKIKQRMVDLGLDIRQHTLVFDRGNNSRKNLAQVAELKLHYVGALTPYHHKKLIEEAAKHFKPVVVGENTFEVYRIRKNIWDAERTVLVFVSDRLRAGQIRGIYQVLAKQEKQLIALQKALANPRAGKRNRSELEQQITDMVKGQFLSGIIEWYLGEKSPGRFNLEYSINPDKLIEVEDKLGFRILITNRHDWGTPEIIQAYHGQSVVEETFKNLKNPHHLALKPQFHWTDQKIRVHNFMCVTGYLLASLIWQQARSNGNFHGTLNSLLDILNNVRLATLLEKPAGRGRPKATWQLEQLSKQESALLETLQLKDFHIKRPKFKGVGVYY